MNIDNASDCASLLPKLEYLISVMSTPNLGNEKETALGEFPQFICVIETNKPFNEKKLSQLYLVKGTSQSVKIDKDPGFSIYLKLLSIL